MKVKNIDSRALPLADICTFVLQFHFCEFD